jgi:hypothetical protein
MTHPLLDLIANRPQLLADHAQAYGELMASEVGAASNAIARRAVLTMAGVASLAIALGLGGVAVMLRAALPVTDMAAPWVLLVVPLVPLAAGAVCLVTARLGTLRNPFDKIWWQVKADVAMFRDATHS